MRFCERCNKTDRETLLFEVICNEGITKMCKECASIEGFAIAKSPSNEEAVRYAISREIKKKPMESGFIDNFHWHIQMARRRAKLSQTQLSKEIQENEATVRKLESGRLPENKDDIRTMKKIQQFFRLKLKKDSFVGDDIELVDETDRYDKI